MSLVSSSIDDYLVASFPLPPPAQGASPLAPPPATTVQYTAHPRQDGRLSVATPGVGVSVYDLADQTPLSSITVGPSFSSTTSAVSRSTPSTTSDSIRVKSARRTWVGVRTEEGKGEIWCWHEEERKDGSTEGEAGKAVWPISEPLAALTAPRTLPSHIVFLSTSGTLALAPAEDLMSLASLPAPSSSSSTLVSQSLCLLPISATSAPAFLPSSLTTLLPPTSSSEAHLAFIVRTYSSPSAATTSPEPSSLVEIGKKKFKKTPRASAASVIDAADAAGASSSGAVDVAVTSKKSEIELVLVDPKISMVDEMEPRLGLMSFGTVEVQGEQVVVSKDGFITALSSDGTLASSRLTFPSAPLVDAYSSLFFPPEPLELTPLGLEPVATLTLSVSLLSLSRASLLALHSSFVLLAAPRISASDSIAPVVSVTLWDARFGSAIATTDLTVPSAVASSLSTLSLSISLPAKHTAIVTLSPSSSSSTAGRTALFGIPLSLLPSSSVLAAVVGKHALTARFLASNAATDSVLAKAKRAEPMRSVKLASQNERKVVLLDASQAAREKLLETLEMVLAPLKEGKKAVEQEKAVQEAERLWDEYIEGERDRLLEYNREKVGSAMEKEQARKIAALKGEGDEKPEEPGRYLSAKKKIERALKAAGASAKVGEEEEEGKVSWKEVTGVRIKGVTDRHRYKYQKERDRAEKELGRTVEDFDVEAAVSKVERYEPSLPSSFITALFRLSFPVPLDAPSSSTDLVIASSSASAAAASKQDFRHPTKIVKYLLERELVGENQVMGGVTAFLARAGDWSNILLALRSIVDIPESITVSLLAAVVRSGSSPSSASSADMLDLDSPSSPSPSSLPQPVPALTTFLPGFLRSPSTPSVLRSQLAAQLSAAEAIPVLELCDRWLAAWLKAGRKEEEDGAAVVGKKGKSAGARTVKGAGDAFRLQAKGVPEMELIIPFVQSLLDAHFVTLLLQRQSHSLLRRLSKRVSAHTQLVTDLSSLAGVLSIYSRRRDEMKKAEERKREEEARKEKEGAAGGERTVKDFEEKMEKRIKAREEHAAVGQYTVETFLLD
ncbi:hypothetical protein JCM8547_002329 [Rhodosporidiobolus lusitaniae]